MAKRRNREHSVIYKDPRGVDSGSESKRNGQNHFIYTENMYIDYEAGGGALESVPGFRKLVSLGGKIHSIFIQKCASAEEFVVVHSGTNLYRFNVADRDNLSTIEPIAQINDVQSHAFHKGGALFVLDGEHIVRIMPDGAVSLIGDDTTPAYIPTTFRNGQAAEQRNLLTKYFRESYVIKDQDKHYRETSELEYSYDDSNYTCSIIGINDTASGSVYIPKYTKLGDKYFRITEIKDLAFAGNLRITEVHIANGLTKIGKLAFKGCKSLHTVHTPSSIEFIDNAAFFDCFALTEVFIGRNIKEFGSVPFSGTIALQTLNMEIDQFSFINVINKADVENYDIKFSSEQPENYYYFPVRTKFDKITEFTFDGKNLYSIPPHEYCFGECRFYFSRSSSSPPGGKECVIVGTISYDSYNYYEDGIDFMSIAKGDSNVIGACTKSAFYDGSIFVSGNPKYPNTVFYSLEGEAGSENDLYFGSLSYFNDGTAGYETTAFAASPEALIVMKSQDDGGGGIFYHQSQRASAFMQKTFPVSYIHTGIGAKANAISIFDETFIVSESGVCLLKKSSSGVRLIKSKSDSINSLFLKNGDLSKTHFTTWCGYVVMQIGGEIYLADSRSPYSDSKSFENCTWYYLTGIGTYKNSYTDWTFMSFAPEGYFVNTDPNIKTSGGINMAYDTKFGSFYYIADLNDPNKKYSVYLTGKATSGTFSPANTVLSVGKLLFFGTESGDLCLFNTDRRGVIPTTIKDTPGFNEATYHISNKTIHPHFYDFASRTPKYVVKTASNDCGFPCNRKNSVPNSLILKLGRSSTAAIQCEIETDESANSITANKLSNAPIDFLELNFSKFFFGSDSDSYAIMNDESKNWFTKQITISSEEYRAPLKICEISYKYKLKE